MELERLVAALAPLAHADTSATLATAINIPKGPASIEGLKVAKDRNWTAPSGKHAAPASGTGHPADLAPGRSSSTDTPSNDADEQAGSKPAEGK